jgi:putative membrane-bound dehydrogenase-like protein
MRQCAVAAFVLTAVVSASAHSADANRLTYLDEFCDPYYVGRDFPKLTTPQWVGESGVDAVVTLAIDDMRGHEKWEAFLRPILERLKKIDGRAPVSIMTCTVDPKQPHLQTWLREGLSLEVHTIDHPCPLLQKGDFPAAKSTYDRCVDLMASIPGNRPVAFRTPCCDSLNTPSPRFYTEIFNKTTAQRNYLQLDSSVFQIFTPNDPDLPREIVLENGRERFRKYVPFKSFVNLIEDYPYPYVIGGLCWQFPCMVPSDWEAQNVLKPNNPITVRDLKLALDATVIKKGVFNFVFHPHGWIRNDQVVELIDYAEKKYGKRVKFLTFRECVDRLNHDILRLRPDAEPQSGLRLIDLNNDGYLDVVRGTTRSTARRRKSSLIGGSAWTHIWLPNENRWHETPILALTGRLTDSKTAEGIGPWYGFPRFGVMRKEGNASVLKLDETVRWALRFDGREWVTDTDSIWGLELDGKPILAERDGIDQGVRLRDLDGDECCELIIANPMQNAVLQWSDKARTWRKLPFRLPEGATIVDEKGRDAGLRFVDVDEDGHDDVLFSNENQFGLYLFKSMTDGWSRKVRAGKRGDRKAIPLISRNGTNNGAFIHSRHLWVQNEDTHRLTDLVDRVSFNDLLHDAEVGPKTPAAALKSFRVRPGFKIELVAAEPLVKDPVAFDWGPDRKFWVAEMADYPTGIDGKGKPGGRVRYLEDTDGDGRYDKSTVFLEGLSYPNSVMAWRDGVLVCTAPDLIYAQDTDGDGRADKREVLFTGFGPGNPQHRYNGLTWGLDNWVYLANGDSGGEIVSKKTGQHAGIRGRDLRIKPDEGLIDPQAGQTQFGRARDDWGNWFGCSNPYPCWHFALEDHYIRRNPHAAAPDPREFVPEQPMYTPVFPISRTLARFNDLHTANRITSACGLTLYRDDLFGPEFATSFFISEPVHNLVHRQVMTPKGATFTSKRADDERASEFVASSDNWFRPTMLRTGPDGALWIADMYRAVIEHPEWIPDDWEARLDLRAGADKGRIYRVAPVGEKRRPIPRLDRLETAGLVGALDSPNGWQRDLVQQLLIWRGDNAAIAPLEAMASKAVRSTTRQHALCTLDGLGVLRPQTVARALFDSHPGVRRHAVRVCEGRVEQATVLADALMRLAADQSPAARDPHVRLQLACTLGQWNDPRAGQLLGKLALEYLADPHISAAALSSLNKNNIDHVLAAVFAGAGNQAGADRLIGQLMKLAAAFGDEDALANVIERVCQTEVDRKEWWQYMALAGIFDELDRRRTTAEDLRKKNGRPRRDALAAMQAMASIAGTIYDDRKTTDEVRLVAMRLLGRVPDNLDKDLQRLSRELVPQASPVLQRAAVERLARIDDVRVPGALLADWASHAPPLRRSILNVLTSRRAWTHSLLDALEKKAVTPADLDAAARQPLLAHADHAIRDRAAKLLAAEANSDRAKLLADYRDVATLRGDAARGREVFVKRCAGCHKLGDVGHVVGPDLAALTNRSLEAMLVATLDPNRAVEDKFINYSALTTDGRQITGMLAAETGNSITLLAQDGKQEVIPRSELDQLKSTGKSLMPEGLEKDVSRQELADVFVYITGLGPRRKEFPGNEPRVIRPAANGTLVLSATNCEIFGTAIMLEEKYKNLGHWSTPDSHAVWTIDVPKAASYRVFLDYACPQETAGNLFVFDAGDVRLTGKVAGTDSWDEYRQMEIGRLALAAGQRTIVFRPDGELKDHLLDLRTIRLVPVK